MHGYNKADDASGASPSDPLLDEFLQRRRELLQKMDRDKIQHRLEQTIDFLIMLRPNGPWQLTAISPWVENQLETRTIKTIDKAREFLYKHNGHWNLYFSPNPVRAENRKAAKTDISEVEFELADLDPRDDEAPDAAQLRYLDALKTFPALPTFLINSGNGINVLWRLDKPIPLPKPVKGVDPTTKKPCWELSPEAKTIIADVEARSKAAMEKLGSVAGTQNIDRVLRLPWTINMPNKAKRDKGRKRCDSSLLPSDLFAVCKLEDFPIDSSGGDDGGGETKEEGPTGGAAAGDIDWTKVEQQKGWLKSVADLPPTSFSAKGRLIVGHSGNLKDLNFDLDQAGLAAKDKATGESKVYKSWSEVSFALAAIFKADGRFASEQVAAALMCDLDCNQHITKIADPTLQRRAVERLIQRSYTPQQQVVRPGEPDWRERRKDGSPRPSMENARLAIALVGITAMYDTFHNKMLFGFHDDTVRHEIEQFFGEVTDNGILALRNWLSQKFGFDLTEKHVRDAIISIALEHCFDPVVDMLAEAQALWEVDRVARLDRMAVDYLNAEDTVLNRAFGRKTMIALVARARNPGCKKDEILVLEAVEGWNKSTVWRVIAGDENFSDEKIIGKDSKEVQELLAGVWIHENADLAGLKKAEVETVKAYASRQEDTARPAFGHFTKKQKRHSIEVGTTNADTYLQSQTGNRRFWPMKVLKPIDLDKVRRDRLLLLGEAAHYQSKGESLFLDEKLWGDAGVEQEARRVTDPWEAALREIPDWVKLVVREVLPGGFQNFRETDIKIIYRDVAAKEDRVAVADLMEQVLKISPGNQRLEHAIRLSNVMRHLGWERAKNGYVSINGERVKGYYRRT
jgi:predicted P-loop ATPase